MKTLELSEYSRCLVEKHVSSTWIEFHSMQGFCKQTLSKEIVALPAGGSLDVDPIWFYLWIHLHQRSQN